MREVQSIDQEPILGLQGLGLQAFRVKAVKALVSGFNKRIN